ncbi:MAG: hypothetical protein ACJAVR_001932 [Paracoccaceae bacterium]
MTGKLGLDGPDSKLAFLIAPQGCEGVARNLIKQAGHLV